MNRSGLRVQLVAGDPAFLSCKCNCGFSSWSAWPVPGGAFTTDALNIWSNHWEIQGAPKPVNGLGVWFRSLLGQQRRISLVCHSCCWPIPPVAVWAIENLGNCMVSTHYSLWLGPLGPFRYCAQMARSCYSLIWPCWMVTEHSASY